MLNIRELPPKILRLWNNNSFPMIIRTGKKGEQLVARLPYQGDNNSWINSLGKSRAKYNGTTKAWTIPKSWFNSFVDSALERYGSIYIVQPFRKMEQCAPACKNAVGHECQCSCMGEHHGSGDSSGWFDVSEAFSFRWVNAEMAVRKLSQKSSKN